VSDWSVQGLGVFVDDIVVSAGAGSTSFEADAAPMDGWSVNGPPPGSDPNPNNWLRTTEEEVGYEEGATMSARDSLYWGFGLEGVTDAADRNALMDRSMDFLND
jgi:hypothetical protein